MKSLNKHSKFIPYIYFSILFIIAFTSFNRKVGIYAFPILLLLVPIIKQLIKPNRNFNFSLGITFVCLSSYLLLAYITSVFSGYSLFFDNSFAPSIGVLILVNFIMSLWIIKNSLNISY